MSNNILSLDEARQRRKVQQPEHSDSHELEAYQSFGPAVMRAEQKYIHLVATELSGYVQNLFTFEGTKSVEQRKLIHKKMTDAISWSCEKTNEYISERYVSNGRIPPESLSHALGIGALLLCRLDRDESAMRITKRIVGKNKSFYEQDLHGKLIVIHTKKRQFDDTKSTGKPGDVLCYRSITDKTLKVIGSVVDLTQSKSDQHDIISVHEVNEPQDELVSIKYCEQQESVEVSLPDQRVMAPGQDVIKAQVWSI